MLSHVDKANRPTMVDVGDKAVTTRTAVARARVVFPADAPLEAGGVLRTKKGPVFDTAIVAGVMAAKRTSELIRSATRSRSRTARSRSSGAGRARS